MKSLHAGVAIVLGACAALAGCQSERLTTRAYELRHPDTDTALIHSVLEEEWGEHSVQSSSEVTNEGYAVVKTTRRGHARIGAKLDEVRR